MAPIRFVFGLHVHQPVGNFDHVFAQHVEDVYRPLLDRLAARGFLPVVLHLSGPLLEWLEAHEPAYLDRLGALASEGKVEILQLPAPVLRDLKKMATEVVRQESERTPMARKVHASFTKFQALVGPWDHFAEGAYHQFVAG